MTVSDIANILDALPRGCRAEIVRDKHGAYSLRVDRATTDREDKPLGPGGREARHNPHVAAPRTAPEIAAAMLAQEGPDAALKLREWGLRLPGISVRELERAGRVGKLKVHVKPHGRDSGARLVLADEMVRYLNAREQAAANLSAAGAHWRRILMAR
jgi:hypothetical protein